MLHRRTPMIHRLTKLLGIATLAFVGGRHAYAQAPPRLTLQDARELALKNHPQIQAAQDELGFANQQIVINRAPYYPEVSGEITGSQGNNLSRIGAGDLSASRLFDRF